MLLPYIILRLLSPQVYQIVAFAAKTVSIDTKTVAFAAKTVAFVARLSDDYFCGGFAADYGVDAGGCGEYLLG